MKFRPPFELDIIKNRAWKSAKMLQHSLRGEHVLGVTALTGYVDATQIAGKIQNGMAWLLLWDFWPPEKEQGQCPPQEDSGQTLVWGSFVPKWEICVIIVQFSYCRIHTLCHNKELCNDRPCSFAGFTLKEANTDTFAFARFDLVYNDRICIWFQPLQTLENSFPLGFCWNWPILLSQKVQ